MHGPRTIPTAAWCAAITAVLVLSLFGCTPAAATSSRTAPATPRSLTADTWNTDGCSASPERGWGWDFHHACIHHDGCYRGHWDSRGTCDRRFLRHMRASCAELHPWSPAGLAFCRWAAALYHLAVRALGSSAYALHSWWAPVRFP